MKVNKCKIAVSEDYVNQIEGGCNNLWTDFGAPLCRGGFDCRLFRKIPSECPEGKKLKMRENIFKEDSS